MYKLKEHELQYQITKILRRVGVLFFETDIMSGLQFFKISDKRRFVFINHHKSMGYVKGQPDFVVLLSGKVVFVELKTETGRQSPEQKDFQEKVKKLGLKYEIWRNCEDCLTFLKKNILLKQ